MNERTLLRRSRTIIGSDAAFLTPDGIDVDATQNYEVVRRRVFFDDVHLVTLHHERGIAYLITTGLFAGFVTSRTRKPRCSKARDKKSALRRMSDG